MTQPSAVKLWKAIKVWYAEHLPEVLESLNPGVSEQALNGFEDELKREVGQRLPQSLRDIYLQNDGQDRKTMYGIFFGLEFLSLENLIDNWNVWRDVASDSFYADMIDFSTFYPEEAIKHKYACAGWFPFSVDGGGNHLGIDLSPGPQGKIGQVINFGADEENKVVVATSFEAFLAWQLAQLQGGNFRMAVYKADGESIRGIEVASTPSEVFLDAVPQLFGPRKIS